jgi:hypothetical protein
MEFINSNISNRKKLFKYLLLLIVPLIITYTLKYLFASKDVQEGIMHSKRMLSLNEFLFFSIFAVIAMFGMLFMSKIILKIVISEADKTITVEFIDRFRIYPKTYTVNTIETQITKQMIPKKSSGQFSNKDYYSVTLKNKSFGELNMTELDFLEIKQIIDYFESLRLKAAEQLRNERLARGSSRRRNN